jgi:hypothetical protein
VNHSLKCWPQYFAALLDGSKTFEIRKNDRNFAVGDVLVIRELCASDSETVNPAIYTGRVCVFDVTYVMTSPAFVLPGFAVLGIAKRSARKT